jgi:tetratricopeptide (TPR) repeat protein
MAVLLAFAALSSAPVLRAQPQPAGAPAKAAANKSEAAKQFKAGVAAFKKKQYLEAAEHFEKAFSLAPHPSALWNAADAREKGGEIALSANLYARYLEMATEADKDRNEAKQRLNSLTLTLGRLELFGPDATDIKVDRLTRVEGASIVYVDPGDHVVSAKVDGKFLAKNVSVASGAKVIVRLVPQSESPPASPRDEVAVVKPDRTTPAKSQGVGPGIVYIGAGVTAVLAGISIGSGLDTSSKRRQFDSSPSAQLYDDGVAAQQRTNILVGVTAAAGVATALVGLFVVRWSSPKEPHVSLTPGGASFSTRF